MERASTRIPTWHPRKLSDENVSELPEFIEFEKWENWNMYHWVETLSSFCFITAMPLLWNTVKAAELDIAVSVGHSLNILTEHIIYLKENPETHHMICITQPRAS